ncbi:PadR family transcriptional regulator [Allofournierella sp.]|uniref:PadR family transcriptional regulator n=1 Tax=Allofournierella sp. TaxID=1940256 RepID=UPI003AF09B6A
MEGFALTEAVYYILLSLEKPLHGYGIMQNTEKLSGGRLHLAAGTLYGALTTLLERHWIEALGSEASSRKKEYKITPLGRQAVRAEMDRLRELLQNGETITKEWEE